MADKYPKMALDELIRQIVEILCELSPAVRLSNSERLDACYHLNTLRFELEERKRNGKVKTW